MPGFSFILRLLRVITNADRAISRSVEKVTGGVNGHEEVSKRFASLQALSRATVRRDAASPLDLMRSNV
jgi:hypothetical protein